MEKKNVTSYITIDENNYYENAFEKTGDYLSDNGEKSQENFGEIESSLNNC